MKKGLETKIPMTAVIAIASIIGFIVILIFASHTMHSNIGYDVCRSLFAKIPILGDLAGKMFGCEKFMVVG